MDDDNRPRPAGQPGELAAQLASESLDPLSQDELKMRIHLLELEIQRTRTHMEKAASHRLAAEALFGSGPGPGGTGSPPA
ncbi:DUF1192 domain-containing protein [Croceicoccus mobilis]|uniref:DUF1192 domain-containing protein n=1 Tax=Croceicoccus mobilis TaxID=1703339 RepID=A0A916YTX3_9SPHN|nr:DUF1192 domain-containing protein [Croceicoccus mobilis]GGD59874.1 hypothetical protein GCM10010990_06620 [Croceicoccus mobilis]